MFSGVVFADDSEATVTLGNTLPEVSNVVLNTGSEFTLDTENTTKDISCTATVVDANGCDDMSSVSSVIYKSDATNGSSCTANGNDCYINASCTLGTCSEGTGSGDYTCTSSIQYYATPTGADSPDETDNWLCTVTGTDATGSGTGVDSSAIEFGSLAALNVPSTLDLGTISVGTADNAAVALAVTNTGNVNLDLGLVGENFSCTPNAETVSLESPTIIGGVGSRYPLVVMSEDVMTPTDYTDFATTTMTTDSASPVNRAIAVTQGSGGDFDVAPSVDGASASKNLYFGFAFPDDSIISSTSCSATIAITADSDGTLAD